MHGRTPHFLGHSRTGRWVALLVAAWTGALALPAARADDPDESAVTDENVEQAIQRAVTWILAQRNDEGHWDGDRGSGDLHWAGSTALALLSLLYADQDPRRDEMDDALEWLARQTLNGTYAYGVRAHTLALVPGKKFTSRLSDDLEWLTHAIWPRDSKEPGAYDYEGKGPQSGRWDNSVSQYGVLGAWMAADAGLSVDDGYWELVGQHWMSSQKPDGGWGYMASNESSGSMTAAGLASLFVVLDQRYADQPKDAGGLLTAISRGLDWMGREYGPTNPRGDRDWHYYYLYGVERVARASGYKYFRNKDWFRGGAAFLLQEQKSEGYWRGTGDARNLWNTSFALMFLCHGRAPLLFNKLQHGPDWDNRLRDVAGLTRYVSKNFERLLNWQIVRLDGTMDDLMEAPVLYLYGESKWEFNDVEVQKVREYCQRGGMVFGVAGKDSDEFRSGFEALARRAFPEFPIRAIAAEHPLFSGDVQFPIDDPPLMLEVHNGVRTLMLLSKRDLANAWNKYSTRGRFAKDFQLATNVYFYATDKSTIRSRLQTPNIPLRKTEIERTIRVARIKYDGKWDLEPFGWTRLARYMNNEAATRLLVTSGVTLDSDALRDFQAAYITGTEAFTLSDAESSGLKKFLNRGGTLLADAAGGSRKFTESLEEHVKTAQKREPRVLRPDSFVLTGQGIPGAIDLAGVTYRRSARSAARGQKYPRLKAIQTKRRIMVIYSTLDLSAGLLGTHAYDVRGYEPDSALRIMRNVLLYAGLPSSKKSELQRDPE